jgi:hypothetical protein
MSHPHQSRQAGVRPGFRFAASILCGATLSACSGSQPASPTPVATATRIIGLAGNLAFGNVQVGSRASMTVTITNSGTGTLTVGGITFTNGLNNVMTVNWTGGPITAGNSQNITVQFAPTAAQAYSGALTVNGDQTSGTNAIAVSGTGVPQLACSYSLSVGTTIAGYPDGGSFSVTVTTTTGCPWTATTTAAWIHVPSTATGSGTGAFTFTVDGNQGPPRTGAVSVAGITVTFNQTSQAGPSFQGHWSGDYYVNGCTADGQLATILNPCANGFQPGHVSPIDLFLTQSGSIVTGTWYFGSIPSATNGSVSPSGHLSLTTTNVSTLNGITFSVNVGGFDATTDGITMSGGWTSLVTVSGLSGSATVQDTIRTVTKQ